jgi:CDP-6-deoxy-D-xylo-4-hexulose-3-dehydrase
MRHTFLEEDATKDALCAYIRRAPKLSMGEEVAAFETAFAKWQGREQCIMVNSGSSANLVLIQALLNLGRLRPGARVGVSAVTWATNVMPVMQLGLTPVLLDVLPETLNVSVQSLRELKVDCVFLTHLLGFSDDVDAIRSYCRDAGIVLLEDTCESLGARWNGTRLGNFGLAATFSTFVGHHMSTIEGGMVVTDDAELADAVRMARAHGWDRNVSAALQSSLRTTWDVSSFYAPYTFYTLGYNVRPTELQGFLGQIQLGLLDGANEKRRETYAYIRSRVQGHSDILMPNQDTPAFAIPVVCRTPEILARCVEACRRLGIEVRPMVAGNMARQPFFQPYHDGRELPGADRLHTCGFYMPNHPDLTDAERNDLCEALSIQA